MKRLLTTLAVLMFILSGCVVYDPPQRYQTRTTSDVYIGGTYRSEARRQAHRRDYGRDHRRQIIIAPPKQPRRYQRQNRRQETVIRQQRPQRQQQQRRPSRDDRRCTDVRNCNLFGR